MNKPNLQDVLQQASLGEEIPAYRNRHAQYIMQQHFHQVRREGDQDQELYKGSRNSTAVSTSFEHKRLIL